jgi:dephospho-CoA kinase
MPNNKIIIGLVGEIASGKDTVAKYLEKKYGSQTVSFSGPLRAILDILDLPQTRENMAWLGVDLRQRFGQDILAKAVTAQVRKSKNKMVALPNVRLPQDITYLKKLPGFHLVHIDADPKIRYQRLIRRSQNADDKSKTWAKFLKDSRLPTEIKIRQLAKKAEYRLDNSGSVENLKKQVDEMMRRVGKPIKS